MTMREVIKTWAVQGLVLILTGAFMAAIVFA